MIARFQISTRASGRRRTAQVRVYETAEELRAAGRRYWARASPDLVGDVTDGTVGLSQSFERLTYETDGRVVRHPEVGFIRLCRPHSGGGVIAHECTHMALAIFGQDVSGAIGDMETEEKLCYLVGELVRGVVNGLNRHGV